MSTVGSLAPGEAFVRFDQGSGRYAVNGNSETLDVVSSSSAFIHAGVPYTEIAFLHTSFPTYGYIATSVIVDAWSMNFGEADSVPGLWVLKTQKDLSCSITGGAEVVPIYSVPAGTEIAVQHGDIYEGDPTKMVIWGVKRPGDQYWYRNLDPSLEGLAWIDTGIANGSGCPYWGIELSRTCP